MFDNKDSLPIVERFGDLSLKGGHAYSCFMGSSVAVTWSTNNHVSITCQTKTDVACTLHNYY